MLFIAWKMLVGDMLKCVSMIAGISFATLLMSQQTAIYFGLAYSTGAAVRDYTGDADLWVMDKAVATPDELKPMRSATLDLVRGIDGVEWAVPILRGGAAMRLPDGTQQRPTIVGLDDATLRGGPQVMLSGQITDLRQDEGIIVDRRQATTFFSFVDGEGVKRPLRVGDRVVLNQISAVVVGVCKLSNGFTPAPVVFTTSSRFRSLVPAEDRQLAFVLVKALADQSLGELSSRIANLEDLIARTPQQFIARTEQYLNESTGILVSFSIVIGLGLVIGLIVSGQTFFNFVSDNSRYFAGLKATGMTDGMIIGIVFTQVGIVSVIGYWLGMGLTSAFGLALAGDGSGFPYRLEASIPIGTAAGVLVVGLISGTISLWRVLRLEPAMVFRA